MHNNSRYNNTRHSISLEIPYHFQTVTFLLAALQFAKRIYNLHVIKKHEISEMMHSLKECQRHMHDLLFYEPCKWIRLLQDCFALWSRFSALPATWKGDKKNVSMVRTPFFLVHYCTASHNTLIHTVKPVAGTLTGVLPNVHSTYMIICTDRHILDSSWKQHRWRLQSFHYCYPADSVDSSSFSNTCTNSAGIHDK